MQIKTKLENESEWNDFLKQSSGYYNLDYADEKDPVCYPCIIVYQITESEYFIKPDLNYIFIYGHEF